MTNLQYSLVTLGTGQALSLFHDGQLYSAHSESHPNWDTIVQKVLSGDESVVDDFDVSQTVAKRFESLSERVAVLNGAVTFDGDVVDSALTRQILRFLDEGVDDWKPLVKFFENVMQNPNEHSREQLYRWLENHNFPINDNGCIVAYKGVNRDAEGNFVSVSSGVAFVDGERKEGQIPNHVGAVVTMPRGDVAHDPTVGCHTGLHAGTWNYASAFGSGGTLTVEINPRDVVSVPTDCYSQKVRVCRYTVLKVQEHEHASAVWHNDPDDLHDEEVDYYGEDAPDYLWE